MVLVTLLVALTKHQTKAIERKGQLCPWFVDAHLWEQEVAAYPVSALRKQRAMDAKLGPLPAFQSKT